MTAVLFELELESDCDVGVGAGEGLGVVEGAGCMLEGGWAGAVPFTGPVHTHTRHGT